MKIKVLIADDHPIVRSGICSLLESQTDLEVVGEAESGREAISMARELMPDVVVMDIAMPDVNGLEATRQIKKHSPHINILALTVYDNEEYFFQMLSAGASGYLPKKAATEELVQAIRAVHQGAAFLYPTVAKKLIGEYLRRVDSGEELASYDGLTPREKEVLKLIAEGFTNQEIANQLYLSKKTIETHKENIMNKLNMHNRVELVKYAIRKGLINIDQ